MPIIIINNCVIVSECEENKQDDIDEGDWLKSSEDCPYFDSISTGIVNNKNNKRKAYHSNKSGNKRFKKTKYKKYVQSYFKIYFLCSYVITTTLIFNLHSKGIQFYFC